MLLRMDRLILTGLMLVLVQSGGAQAEDAYPVNTANQADTNLFASAPNEQLTVREGDILTHSNMSMRSFGVREQLQMWEDGVVPYYIDPQLHASVAFTVEKAIDSWNRLSVISLVAINPNNSGSPSDYLHFIPAQGCASWIGRQGGAQPVWTAPSCSTGSMIHEIGHAIGLEHEHTRPDRDQHIKVNWENVSTQKAANFAISDNGKKYYGPYDFSSIMHYGEYFFSANGEPTIEAIEPTAVTIGQRVAPSAGDVAAIAAMYGGSLSLVSSVSHTNGQTEISISVTNDSSNGANNIELTADVGNAMLVQNTSDSWRCSTANSVLVCNLDTLSGSEHSAFVLVLDSVRTESELGLKLVTKSTDATALNLDGLSLSAVQPLNLGAANESTKQQGDALYADVPADTAAASMGHWLAGILFFPLIGRRMARRAKIAEA